MEAKPRPLPEHLRQTPRWDGAATLRENSGAMTAAYVDGIVLARVKEK